MGLFTKLNLAGEKETPRQTKLAAEFLEGWHAFCANKPLMLMTVFVVFLNCTYTVINTSAIYFAKDHLRLSSSLLAVVLSASGAGGLAGSLILRGWAASPELPGPASASVCPSPSTFPAGLSPGGAQALSLWPARCGIWSRGLFTCGPGCGMCHDFIFVQKHRTDYRPNSSSAHAPTPSFPLRRGSPRRNRE